MCSRTLIGWSEQPMIVLSGRVACDLLFMLTRAILMTSSHSEGDQAAQFQLGEVYYFGGWGEQQNYTKAHSHFFRARGLVGAQARLGEMYAYGLGVRQNYKKAFGLLQTAANHRHGRSQALLGQ